MQVRCQTGNHLYVLLKGSHFDLMSSQEMTLGALQYRPIVLEHRFVPACKRELKTMVHHMACKVQTMQCVVLAA
jgi:hypothetical protein